jgi:hypothetical protein
MTLAVSRKRVRLFFSLSHYRYRNLPSALRTGARITQTGTGTGTGTHTPPSYGKLLLRCSRYKHIQQQGCIVVLYR